MQKTLFLITLIIATFALVGCEVTPEDLNPETYTITLESSNEDATLSQDPEGPHEEGDEVEISAAFDDATYRFVAWQEGDDVLSEDATFSHTVERDATFEAVFEEESDDPETYTLSVGANVSGVDFTFDPEGPYEANDTVNITPDYDDTAYQFVEWLEDHTQISESEVLEYTVQEDATLEAVFEEITVEPATYTDTFEDLPVSGSTYETGSFTGVNGVEWSYTDVRGDQNLDGSKAATLSRVESGRDPHISATIQEGIRSFSVEFTNAFSTPAQLELFIDDESVGVSDEVEDEVVVFEVEDLDVTGEFEFELRATNGQTTIDNLTWDNNVAGSDDPEVTLNSSYWDADLSVSPSNKEPAGTEVTVSASDPNDDYAFLRWEDSSGNAVSEDANYTFTLEEDIELKAVFDNPERVELTLDSNLYRADLSSDPSEMPVVPDTDITVSASDPDSEYDFVAWEDSEGNEVSTDSTFTYTIGNDDETLNAVFDIPEQEDYENMTLDELTDLDLSSEYDSLEGLYGDDLRTAIQNLISDVDLETYGEARTILADTDEDPDNPDNLILFYTRESVNGEWDEGATWNREHIWPQSYMPEGADNSDANMASDLHALVSTDTGENSSRGNQHFTLEGEGGYEPHDEVKGDTARMLFYMEVMYDDLTLVDGAPAEDSFEMGDLESLLQWHVSDGISDYEDRRNDVVESYQGNRNPFIDYPHLAYLIHYDHPEVGLD